MYWQSSHVTLYQNTDLIRPSLMRIASCAAVLTLTMFASLSAFAGSGWYLLVPPTGSYDERARFLSGFKTLDRQPLPKWGQRGSYDSASECEAVKHSSLMVEQNFYAKSLAEYTSAQGANKDPALLRHMRLTTEIGNANVSAFLASRCIKSDDARLRN